MTRDRANAFTNRWIVASGAVLSGLAVVLGAFGAHALKGRIAGEALGWWQTGVQYQMWHGLAVFSLGLLGSRAAKAPALLFVTGATVFSGSLYVMALGGPRWLGAVTPFGGAAMIGGWAVIAVRGVQRTN